MQSILVADHHTLMREGLVLILRELVRDNARISSIPSYAELILKLENSGAEMILIDPHMPGSPGNAVFTELRRHDPNCMLVAISGRTDQQMVAEALRNGARGFIPKASGSGVLQEALKIIWAGGVFVPNLPGTRGLANDGPDGYDKSQSGLTRRQTQVLHCIRRGCSNRDIAVELGMSEGTVKNHVKALMRVLKVRNRTQAALLVL